MIGVESDDSSNRQQLCLLGLTNDPYRWELSLTRHGASIGREVLIITISYDLRADPVP